MQIILSAISPEASDLLDQIMLHWQAHCIRLPPGYPQDPAYALAYWLVRWSGLVQPTPNPPTVEMPTLTRPELLDTPQYPLVVALCPYCRRAGIDAGQSCPHCGQLIAEFEIEIV
jgi:hypothetical protein